MSLEVVFEAEAQATGGTSEGFLSRVDHTVLQQPHPALECLVALVALVRPFLGVRPFVHAQVAGGGEALGAGLAGVRPCPGVHGLVLPQALLARKALSADVAHEGLDFGVRHLVVSQCPTGCKGAVTCVALEWRFLKPVTGLVRSKLTWQPELPVALVTAQQLVWVALLRLAETVGEQVALQRLRFVETFVAGAAGERLQVARGVLQQLVLLMEAFVTQLAEKPLLLVQLPPPPPLLLLLLLLAHT